MPAAADKPVSPELQDAYQTAFAAELEKFRPYQQRLTQTLHHQHVALQELTQLWNALRELAGRGEGARRWDERERRKNETVKRFGRARDGYMEARDGVACVLSLSLLQQS